MKLSVIVPTKNEMDNIEPLLQRLDRALQGIAAEVLFVDDSTDQTPERIREQGDRCGLAVSLVERPLPRQRDGLGGAVVEGFGRARGEWACVMDADLQHPPELIPHLLSEAQSEGVDLVLGTRLAKGGSTAGLGLFRAMVSRVLAGMTRVLFWKRLQAVSDPLTGLFLVRLDALDVGRLRPDGFKILLEVLVRCPTLRVTEIPFKFGSRGGGKSKSGFGEGVRLFRQYARLWEARFPRFLAVGLSGLVVNTLVLALATGAGGLFYLWSALLATQTSTLWNFCWTDAWVFQGRRNHRPRWQRLSMYYLMNNAALLVRAPVMLVLTSGLGLHYLLSNLVTLGILAVLRYAAADKGIWLRALPRRQLPAA